MSLLVRPAGEADVAEISRILIASITLLCRADHQDDPAIVAAWTANKSHDGVRGMMAMPESEFYVVERDGQLAAVGALSGDTVTLNYVDPDHRRSGASRALMQAMEQRMAARNVAVARLKSTATARGFYLSQGWIEDAPAPPGRFIQAFPMHKALG